MGSSKGEQESQGGLPQSKTPRAMPPKGGAAEFVLRAIGYFKTALSRQTAEAVRIIPTGRRETPWLYYSGQDIPLLRNRPPSFGGQGMREARV